MRVLVVAESFLPQVNGVTNSVRRVLDHLALRGHEAMLVAPTGPDTYAGFPVVRVHGLNLPLTKGYFRIGIETRHRLRSLVHAYNPDVVHVASPATLGYQALHVAKELGVPSVAIYQTDLVGFAERYRIPGVPSIMAALTRAIHEMADVTLAPSSASLKQLHELGIDNTDLWARGVDVELFDPRKRDNALRALLAPHGEVIVGFVGRIAPEKELDLLAKVDANPNTSVVLVGAGADMDRLKRVLPNAKFLGMLHGEELATAYASLDIFVHTGRFETFCQSAQEALASGVPAIAPSAGGPLDIIDDGVSGLFFAPGDADHLAAQVQTLAGDVELRQLMGLNAREQVFDKSWEAINDRLLANYAKVCHPSFASAPRAEPSTSQQPTVA